MAINRTIDLLPEYFRTIPNQRFLNSTLDRLVSDPQLRQFDGYVGRRIVNGTQLLGSYITEPTAFRTRYQLEPEFVFRAPGQPTRHQIGLFDSAPGTGWALCDGSSATFSTSSGGTTSAATPNIIGLSNYLVGGPALGSGSHNRANGTDFTINYQVYLPYIRL